MESDLTEIYKKLSDLRKLLKSFGSATIAFSGGVDSTFLLKVAHEELGEKAVAVTVVSPLIPKKEAQDAENF